VAYYQDRVKTKIQTNNKNKNNKKRRHSWRSEVLESFVRNMLRHGASPEEVIEKAISMSREAYHKLANLEIKLDRAFGSSSFRKNTIDPLLSKERQIDAIRARTQRGGKVRTSDGDNLQSLLGRCLQEYEALRFEFPWSELELANRRLVTSYIDERRNHLQLGDAERVRSTYLDALNETAIA
jgi:hypothetical protein